MSPPPALSSLNGASAAVVLVGWTLTITADPADLDGDGFVNASDLGRLLVGWGVGSTIGDVNGDGDTDSADVGLLLGRWTG